MTATQVSTQPAHGAPRLADAIRRRVLLLLQSLDVPALCEEAGLDPDRLTELLADPRPSAELVAWVARLANMPVAEVMFGAAPEPVASAPPPVRALSPDADLMLRLAGRLEALDTRIERAMHALAEVETRLSAAGLTPSDLIPPEMVELYSEFLGQPEPASPEVAD